jgi:uncharacterized protein (TIGR03435 family)
MRPDLSNIDKVLDRYLPSASRQETESAGSRVLRHLQTMTDQADGEIEGGVPPDFRPESTWARRAMVGAAAVLVAVAIGTAIVWRPGFPERLSGVPQGATLAVVDAVDGSLSRIVEGRQELLRVGDRLESGEPVRTNGSAGAVLALTDGSRVEMRSQSELSLERADDGVRIRLQRGGIVVNAAKQRTGHLHVQTKDMTVSVVGTVFVVNAEDDGSRVTVIEGEVRVREGTAETSLRPGDHVSTSPTLAVRPLTEEVAWSRRRNAYVAILTAFEKGMAETSGPLVRVGDPPSPARAQATQAGAATGRQEFDEASIRPCDPDNLPPTPIGARGGGANSFYMTPGRAYALCLTLATLIRTAYGYAPMDLEFMNTTENASRPRRQPGMRFEAVYGLGMEDGRRVRGGPDWVRAERYTIEAVANGPADAAALQGPMLRALLERRFQLRVHIEAEQVPAYALTVASGGLTIKPMQEGDCNRDGLNDAVRAERARLWEARGPVLITEAVRLGIKPTCGTVYGDWNGPNMRTEHVAQSPGSVAGSAGAALGARVVDRTGITDRFVFAWEFAPDETTPAYFRDMGSERTGSRRPGFDGSSALPKAPSIFTALEQQLGLKLEPIQVPREFIVIDRVERPSPN